MKKKPNKWMLLAVAGMVAAGTGWLVSGRYKEESRKAEPVVAERLAAEQEFLDAVLESPERMDGAVAASAEPGGEVTEMLVCTLPTGKERRLLSDIEKPPAPRPLKEPVSAESLYFWNDYASLRKDAIRNPDSEENREGVVSLMKTRQRRLGQK